MSNGSGDVDYGTELGKHIFLPWIRRGVGTQLSRVDGDANAAPRATLDAGITIGPGPLSNAGPPTVVPLSLFGPGDVTALDPRVVIRTWPRPDVFDAEPNFFPLIELQPADLPWRYTPARANAKDRLRPWLSLIVLRDDEIASLAVPSAEQPQAVVTVKSATSLPLLDQSWAWAHVQVTGEPSIDQAGALDLLDQQSHRILARLLCPRRLDSRTAYTAFLVPSLERARLAGLKQAVPDAVDGMAPAWQPADTNVQLPVYYQWRFQAGDTGDFESLVRRVQPRPMPSTVGSRPMDETDPGLALPAASPAALNAEAALRALDSASTPWDTGARAAWTAAIENVLNRPADLLAAPGYDRVVAPPLYGRWYAACDKVDSVNPDWWFTDLNIDTRTRVGAGVGTLVIQNKQQQYLAGAWAQVAGIRAANAALRAAQLAREAALSVYTRSVLVRSAVSTVAFTASVHSRILASPRTVAAVTRESPLAAGLLLPAWRRLSRPRGPLGNRLARAGSVAGPTILERVNSGAVRIAPPPPLPIGLATLGRVGAGSAPAWATPSALARLTSILHPSWVVVLALLLLAAILFLIGAGAVAIALAVATIGLRVAGPTIAASRPVQDLSRRVALRNGTLTPDQVLAAPPRPTFTPVEFTSAPPQQPAPAVGTTEQPAATRFRSAAAAAFGAFQAPAAAGPVLRSVDFAVLGEKIVAALDPRITVAASFRQRTAIAPAVTWTYPDSLEPIMAAPSFDDPMYAPLAALSRDWILPGLDDVPQDTVSVLQTNERFVESYMVGINHEMSRTLLFNEYPTDQRGTYFRQFWDSRATVPSPGHPIDPETLKDIKPIHTWGRTSGLGHNSSRQAPPGGDYLVLLLRAELLRRYPNTVVYATRAKWNAQRTHDVDDTTESHPVFSGQLGSGVGFWGFELTATQVRGGTRTTDDPGWFFILQEPPTEPRCGLEPATQYGVGPTKWPDLSWDDLAADGSALANIMYIDLNAALPDTTSVVDSRNAAWHADAGTGATGARASDLAYITYRVPIRIAVHASTMIPSDVTGP